MKTIFDILILQSIFGNHSEIELQKIKHMAKERKTPLEKTAANANLAVATKEEAANTGISLFTKSTTPIVETKGMVERSLPKLIRPSSMEVGDVLEGILYDAIPSTKKDKDGVLMKGYLLNLVHPSNARIAFPATAVVAGALGATPEAAKAYIGHRIMIQKTGIGQQTDSMRKPATLFRVLVSEEPVKDFKK